MTETDAGAAARNPERIATDLLVRFGFLALFAYWSISIVSPFIAVVIWAIILAVALYPLHARLAATLGGRPRLAASLITICLLSLVLLPLVILGASVIESVEIIRARLARGALIDPPMIQRLAQLPMVGAELGAALTQIAQDSQAFLARHANALLATGSTIAGRVAGLAGGLIGFAVSVLISGFLYSHGPALAAGGRRLAERVVGLRGAEFVDLAGATVRGVARGVIGVALLQSLLFGIGLVVAGVPGAGLIALATLILCILQLGVFLPAVGVLIWAWTTMDTTPALLLTLYILPIAVLDNVLRPIVMARGLPTPMLIIIVGLLGGMLSYGLIGIFLGPIVLAVFYELIVGWVRSGSPEVEARAGGME